MPRGARTWSGARVTNAGEMWSQFVTEINQGTKKNEAGEFHERNAKDGSNWKKSKEGGEQPPYVHITWGAERESRKNFLSVKRKQFSWGEGSRGKGQTLPTVGRADRGRLKTTLSDKLGKTHFS